MKLEGYRVETAGDGKAGLAAVDKVQPVLVITDQSTPGMDGIELCHQLRREPKLARIPLILGSADHEIAFGAPVWTSFGESPCR